LEHYFGSVNSVTFEMKGLDTKYSYVTSAFGWVLFWWLNNATYRMLKSSVG